jgi:PTH1 family peptidyl-tRNA hydrolase
MCEQQDNLLPEDQDGAPQPLLVVGLGNPGSRYEGNRHNIGFMVLDRLAQQLGREFTVDHQHYRATEIPELDSEAVLMKPLTYMNLSGEAVAAWLQTVERDFDPRRMLVVCDDLALPLGTVRLRGKGSSGGQNGLGSIIEVLQTESFPRLRLGVDGTDGELEPENWPDYVLSDFSAEEVPLAQALVEAGAGTVRCWLEHGLERAASTCNGRISLETDDPEPAGD